MHRIATILLCLFGLVTQPLAAQEIAYEPVADVELSTELGSGGARFVFTAPAPVPDGIAAYGPFRVIDAGHAALVDVTDADAPAAFAAMLRDYPGIATLEMIECPGTEDDRANLRLGRMIRAHGLTTHVPEGGFAGSGAVELFLAGAQRFAEPGAQFAVHSWSDDAGREPQDYAADAPENRAYTDYYQAMGMTAAEARAFYAMTNSVPFADAKWLTGADMAQWVRLDTEPTPPAEPAPVLQFAFAPAPEPLPVLDLVLALQ